MCSENLFVNRTVHDPRAFVNRGLTVSALKCLRFNHSERSIMRDGGTERLYEDAEVEVIFSPDTEEASESRY